MNARELGLKRYKKRFRIMEALAEQTPPATIRAIAQELGISAVAVRRTLLGETHSERILQAFRDAGVPEEYLFDPRRYGIKMRGCGLAKKELLRAQGQ